LIQISSDINRAATILQEGGLVAIPTETVYGLAGNIFNESAIKKIFKTKQRPLFNPLIVHVKSREYVNEVAEYIPPKATQLADAFWPGPLTLVLKKKPIIPDLITAGKDTVALRMPDHPLTQKLLNVLDFPVAAPSANPFGRISPTKAEHVANYFADELEMVLDGGPCQSGIESTIIGFDGDNPILYRLGSISKEDIEAVVGPVESITKNDTTPDAPGMLSRHYAPTTPTVLSNNVLATVMKHQGKRIGVLFFKTLFTHDRIAVAQVLSPDGSEKEAASNLYAALHDLDKMNLDVIIAERLPDHGLGASINDRLLRATK